MRKILFRGKRVDDGKWVCGYYVLNAYLPGTIEEEIYPTIHPTIVEHKAPISSVDPLTVGQYTGLADKNGKKIFEGDIVAGIAYSSRWVGVIVWIDEIASFGVRYRHRGTDSPTSWENSSILKALSRGCKSEHVAEVIGNIHDNPELLEAES